MALKNRRTQKNNINKRVQKRTKRKSLGKKTRKNLRKKRQNRKTRRRRFRGGMMGTRFWRRSPPPRPPRVDPPRVPTLSAEDMLDSAISKRLNKISAKDFENQFQERYQELGKNILGKRIKISVQSTIDMYGSVNIGQILTTDYTFRTQGDLWDFWLDNMNECPTPKISSPMWDAKLIYLAIEHLKKTPNVHYKKVFIVTDPLCAHINPGGARGGDVDDTVAAIYAICKLHEINGGQPVDLTFIVHCGNATARAEMFKQFLQYLIIKEKRGNFMTYGSIIIGEGELYKDHPGIKINIVAIDSGTMPFVSNCVCKDDKSLLFVNAPIKLKGDSGRFDDFQERLNNFTRVFMQGYDVNDMNMVESSPENVRKLLNQVATKSDYNPDSNQTFGYFTHDNMVKMQESITGAAAAPSADAAMGNITETIVNLNKEIKQILLYDIKVHLLGQACGLDTGGLPGNFFIGFYFTTGTPYDKDRPPNNKWIKYKENVENDNTIIKEGVDNKGNKLWSWWLSLTEEEEGKTIFPVVTIPV